MKRGRAREKEYSSAAEEIPFVGPEAVLPYREPDKSTPYPFILFQIHFNIVLFQEVCNS
jgi:hypothetical protein